MEPFKNMLGVGPAKTIAALKEMTKVFTTEFAVRPFFLRDEKYMLKTFKQWSDDVEIHLLKSK